LITLTRFIEAKQKVAENNVDFFKAQCKLNKVEPKYCTDLHYEQDLIITYNTLLNIITQVKELRKSHMALTNSRVSVE